MPRQFAMSDRAYAVLITLGKVGKVRAAAQVDLLNGTDIVRMSGDTLLLATTLYHLAEPADGKPMPTLDEWLAAFDNGDALDAATAAMTEALVDFTPAARRDALRSGLATMAKLTTEIANQAAASMTDEAIQRIAREALATIRQTIAEPSPGSPPLSDSTPPT